MKLNKILVTTDFSELAEKAYGPAVDLSKKFGASLLLVHSAESMPPYYYMHLEGITTDIPKNVYLDELTAQLQEEASRHAVFEGVDVETHLIYHAYPQKALAGFATKNDVDLIVTTTHGRTGLGHFFLGSYAERLLRLSTVPVLVHRETVPPATKEAKSPVKYKKVLVPFDFSENSKAVFPQVKFLSEAYSAKFTFVHVLSPIPYTLAQTPGSVAMAAVREAFFEAPEMAKKRFAEIRDQELAGIDADMITLEGAPASEVVRVAQEDGVDLILMATHGWTGFQHLVMGSVAEKIAQKAHCSVLSVRPPESETQDT